MFWSSCIRTVYQSGSAAEGTIGYLVRLSNSKDLGVQTNPIKCLAGQNPSHVQGLVRSLAKKLVHVITDGLSATNWVMGWLNMHFTLYTTNLDIFHLPDGAFKPSSCYLWLEQNPAADWPSG